MNRIFNFFLISSLFVTVISCKNDISYDWEATECEMVINNLRQDYTGMNVDVYGINGTFFSQSNTSHFIFDYSGNCIDSTTIINLLLETYYVDSLNQEVTGPINTYNFNYSYKDFRIIDNKIRLGLITRFSETSYMKASVKVLYNAFNPQTGLVQKESNTIVLNVEKLDGMN